MTYQEKLTAIRQQMARQEIDAYLIHAADPHMSEYLPAHYKCLEFACGFTGSAGVIVITADFAGLWTDSRYFTQAAEQLAGTGYELVKLQVPHTPEYIQWLKKDARVACNFKLLSVTLYELFKTKGFDVKHADLLAEVWKNRPALPQTPAFLVEEKYTGSATEHKIKAVQQRLQQQNITAHVISSLDDIAWLFNIRGNDVKCNPVVLAFALISSDRVALFIDPGKLNSEAAAALTGAGVKLFPYIGIEEEMAQLPSDSRVWIDPKRTCAWLYQRIPAGSSIHLEINPTTHLKSVKNEIEIANFKLAMVRDGVAMTRFVKWLEEQVGHEEITERSASARLAALRAAQPDFAGLSFEAIAGYKAHAALPHYTPTAETDLALAKEGMFLIDSGGQYWLGTTDITRMVILGPLTEEQQTDYTLVLRGVIEGSSAVFPRGTCGYQLDGIIRKPLWDHARNYGHGTGHGVGYFLNVHEGPQSISPDNLPIPFVPGMVTSIEPGIYRPGKHGLRIENLVLTVAAGENEFGAFLKQETLTLALIDTKGINLELLETRHITWLNDYHQQVIRELGPYLDPEELEWLINSCRLPGPGVLS